MERGDSDFIVCMVALFIGYAIGYVRGYMAGLEDRTCGSTMHRTK